MLGDSGEYSVSDRLSELIRERFEFLFPLKIIEGPEILTIIDHRPTPATFLTAVGALLIAAAAILIYLTVDGGTVAALGTLAASCIAWVIVLFKGTLREVYYFDVPSDTYLFVRRFIHRKDVMQGALSQFTFAEVRTVENEGTESHHVVLRQQGMFLAGVEEQLLREETPIFNTFEREARIAEAINRILSAQRKMADHV